MLAIKSRQVSFDDNAPLIRCGQRLVTRLARSKAEIRAAQSLRYKVFYQEMSAIADAKTLLTRLDRDDFDDICDHLLVVDRQLPGRDNVVATYRLLRQRVAVDFTGFYSSAQFDLAPMFDAHRQLNFLELGRSCVLQSRRHKRTVELLWQGVWNYVLEHNIDVMFGCASFPGTRPDRLAGALSFLYHHARAPAGWRVGAAPGRGFSLNMMASSDIDCRRAMKELPPLIKGYLRIGAWIGEQAVVDQQFGTIDVLVILPVANINRRYVRYFDPGRRNRLALS